MLHVIVGRWMDGNLKCYVTTPAVEGKASREFIRSLAKLLKLPAHAVAIEKGVTTRVKRVAIDTSLTYKDFVLKVGL